MKKVVSPNGSLTVSFMVAGKTADVGFSGLAGQVISSIATSAGTFSSNCDVQLSLQNPSGSTIAGPVCAGQAGSLPSQTLPTTGTYTVVVAPTPTVTGSVKLAVKSTGSIRSITPNASGIKVSAAAGASVSFGTIVPSGTTLSALATASTGFSGCPSYRVSVQRPDGTTIQQLLGCDTGQVFLDAFPSQGAGTYTLELENLGTTSGTTKLSITHSRT
jgi:hypothetical protein